MNDSSELYARRREGGVVSAAMDSFVGRLANQCIVRVCDCRTRGCCLFAGTKSQVYGKHVLLGPRHGRRRLVFSVMKIALMMVIMMVGLASRATHTANRSAGQAEKVVVSG